MYDDKLILYPTILLSFAIVSACAYLGRRMFAVRKEGCRQRIAHGALLAGLPCSMMLVLAWLWSMPALFAVALAGSSALAGAIIGAELLRVERLRRFGTTAVLIGLSPLLLLFGALEYRHHDTVPAHVLTAESDCVNLYLRAGKQQIANGDFRPSGGQAWRYSDLRRLRALCEDSPPPNMG